MPLTIAEPELRAWIRLSLEPDLDAAQARQLLSALGLPQDIYAAPVGQLARLLGAPLAAQLRQETPEPLQAQIEQALDWLRAPTHTLLTLADPLYPPALLQLGDPPLVLYAHGCLDVLSRPKIAIVGARHANHEGERNAFEFAQYLAGHGWCVISGLASGIDGAAHAGALQAGPSGGGTLAVLGTGIDRVYPAAHRPLAHRIAEHGLMLSEFPLGAQGLPFHFPKRNRLVAALSQGVLVVQAAPQSGSLITARLAGELGREVFAIPGSIHSPLSRGCHRLIRQGAKLVESGQDILEELAQGRLDGLFTPPAASTTKPCPDAEQVAPAVSPMPAAPTSTHAPAPVAPDGPAASRAGLADTDEAQVQDDSQVLLQALHEGPASADDLHLRLGWPMAHLMAELTLLEIDGHILRQADGCFTRR
ncbi:DNA-processing protein DprA [Castellaniella caeni]|uniref:DNA-processing protein DprA n=1 Tax=Castellaniella caeni TaxID=266123 RepID=UPI00082CD126|nr:DNA-processing protein DprA [Castellaniella caeni]